MNQYARVPRFSIVVPVFNAAPYLRRCVESVMEQTHRNWELLLVDDGSTDESGALCDQYAQQDPRIRVLHQDNKGASHARNQALDIATGDFVLFLDSDDHLAPTCLEACDRHLVRDNRIDTLQFNYVYFKADGASSAIYRSKVEHAPCTPTEYAQLGIFFVCICGWCFRRTMIEAGRIRFDTRMRYHEDRVFDYQCLSRSALIKIIPDLLYYYEGHTDSVSANIVASHTIVSTSLLAAHGRSMPLFRITLANQALDYAIACIVAHAMSRRESATLLRSLHLRAKDVTGRGRKLLLLIGSTTTPSHS